MKLFYNRLIGFFTILLGNSYTVIANTHCGGRRIKQWKDGLDSNYGKVKGIRNCKRICDAHEECNGFVHRETDHVCGFWKGAPLKPKEKEKRNCYEKQTGR